MREVAVLGVGMHPWGKFENKSVRVSAYATAMNLLEKNPDELASLRELGLTLLYIGPESGDDATLKRIAKGAGFAEHVEAARKAKDAGIELSAIFLLGAGGIERSAEHARASARLASEMDPKFVSALTLTVIPGTPIATLEERGKFALPPVEGLLRELRTFIDEARPTDAIFRTNHASNYLPLSGRLPRDRVTEMLSELLPKKTKKRTVPVAEARRILLDQEFDKLINLDDVVADALERVETLGIIFLDEIDKIAGTKGDFGGPDVSREGVQRDLLPIVEGSTVNTKYGMVKTDHILFIAAGAFSTTKPSDLIPELQGRFPIRVELDSLTKEDFIRILTEPSNALVKQYIEMLATEGV